MTDTNVREPRQPIWRWDDEREGEFPFCPVCEGCTVNTPSGYVVCNEAGSEHFRQSMADVFGPGHPDPEAVRS